VVCFISTWRKKSRQPGKAPASSYTQHFELGVFVAHIKRVACVGVRCDQRKASLAPQRHGRSRQWRRDLSLTKIVYRHCIYFFAIQGSECGCWDAEGAVKWFPLQNRQCHM
jgi:hypothetical protein